MQIRQLQVATDSVQDRLVLRVATEANEEFRIFFTRRFLREVWPHLSRLLAGQIDAIPAAGQDESVSHEPGSFEQPFKEDNPVYPLGAAPLLASEASFEQSGDDMARLILREGRERSFSLNLNAELLQALCAMLRAGSEQAKWDLGLNYETPAAIRPAAGKSLLH